MSCSTATVILGYIPSIATLCELNPHGGDKGQSLGFMSRSTTRVILGQALSITTCGTRTHRGDSL